MTKNSSRVEPVGFVYLWSYETREGREAEFEKLYGPAGGWAQLFRESPQYFGTDLLRDKEKPGRYITVDRWVSRADHKAFVTKHQHEFTELDRQGERLTQHEALLGNFELVSG